MLFISSKIEIRKGVKQMPYRPLKPQDVADKARTLFEKYNVEKAAVFGSCSRNEMQRGSDIDLLVEVDLLSNPLLFIELKRKLESALKRKVDLISYKSLEQSVSKATILSEAKVIYEKKH